MPCKQWNETWVAHLYDELDEAEARELREHLDSCEPCTRHMDELAASRAALQDACPVVPAAPNVIVLRPRRWLQPLWAYAAGATFAMLVFAGGLLAGYHLLGNQPVTGPVIADAAPSNSEQALLARMNEMQRRIVQLEQIDDDQPAAGTVQASFLTQGQFDDEIRRLERRSDVQRARDFQFLLDEITASELRTGVDIDATRQALNVVAVKSDPRFMER